MHCLFLADFDVYVAEDDIVKLYCMWRKVSLNRGKSVNQLNFLTVFSAERVGVCPCESVVPEDGGPGVGLLVTVHDHHHRQGRRAYLGNKNIY